MENLGAQSHLALTISLAFISLAFISLAFIALAFIILILPLRFFTLR